MAHEINNPIGFIRSNLETLEKYLESIQLVLSAYDQLSGQLTRAAATAELSDSIERINLLIKDRELDFIAKDAVSCIKESLSGTKRVEAIVRNMKDFSRTESA